MKRSGLLIRFVDVVLILLFGFIAISEIKLHNDIDLARSTENKRSEIDKGEIVFVGVTKTGAYSIDAQEATARLDDVARYLKSKKGAPADSADFKVRVFPDSSAHTEAIKEVLRVCDQLEITKEVAVYRFDDAPTPGREDNP